MLRRLRRSLAGDRVWVAAAGVAYCALFAAIPGVTVAVGLLGGHAAAWPRLEMAGGLLPDEAGRFLADQVRAVAAGPRLHLGGALLVALWAARTGAATLVSALNITYGVEERRGLVRQQAVLLLVTAALCLFGLLGLVLVAVLPAVADALPLAPGTAAAVSLGRWPALAALMGASLAAFYRHAPCRPRSGRRGAAAGAAAATALWLAGSAGLSWYVAHVSSYSAVFGALGMVMLLMTWFYLTALCVLLGAELDAAMGS